MGVAKMGRSARPLVGFGLLVLCFMAAMAEGEYLKYKDPKQPLGARIKDLMKRMSLEEKIGQMTQIERKVASADVMKQYFIGSVLSGGGSVPAPKASVQDWVNMVNEIQKGALSTRLGIPMIYGIDAVHGHNNVYKATIFPHNVGLGATRDPELVKRIGAATALEVRATGIPYAFAPCIAVCRDPRWGRCYESYSEDHKIVQMMTEIIPGLQGDLPANSHAVPFVAGKTKVAACAKHFVGDGGTVKGVDESNTVINIKDLFSIHMPAYYDSIKKGVATVMVSYSSVNGEKMHANGNLVTGFLKNKLKFRGFVISDWQGIDRITNPPHANYTYSVQAGILAGIDMIMVPENYAEYLSTLTELVKKNIIPMSRINDAVKRILRVKILAEVSFFLSFFLLTVSRCEFLYETIIMVLVETFWEILERPTIDAVVVEMMMFLGPLWVAFFLGVIIGWTWKPKWASLGNCKFDFSAPSSPTAFVPSPAKALDSTKGSVSSNARTPSFSPALYASWDEDHIGCDSSSQSQDERADINVIMDEDLEHFCHLVERRDGGPCWKHMMDRSTPGLSYQAWQRDPETGPPQYCSRTVYEDATPELLRDFFWDDEFRLKWDDMMVHASILEECPATGAMVLHWVRKFPFFCSDREYIIGRRMWESGRSYYCITKGVQCPSVPRRDKPRRVDLYYSSWFIQAVESRRGNGELTACEVILFHHEDMGIPWELIKFGARQGMWGAVKKIERGLRAYQQARASGEPISHCASMAQTNTKIDPVVHLKSLEGDEHSSPNTELLDSSSKKPIPVNIPKILVLSGVVAVACTLDGGLLPKALLFDIARRLANLGRGSRPGT